MILLQKYIYMNEPDKKISVMELEIKHFGKLSITIIEYCWNQQYSRYGCDEVAGVLET